MYGEGFMKNNMDGFLCPFVGKTKRRKKKHRQAQGNYRSNDKHLNSAAAAARPEPQLGTTRTVFPGSVLLVCSLLHDRRAMARQLHLSNLDPNVLGGDGADRANGLRRPSCGAGSHTRQEHIGAQLQAQQQQQHLAAPGFIFVPLEFDSRLQTSALRKCESQQ